MHRRFTDVGPRPASNLPEPNRPQSGDQMDQGFNIDDILHMDVIPGMLRRLKPLLTILISLNLSQIKLLIRQF
jgi:hypothetical protein